MQEKNDEKMDDAAGLAAGQRCFAFPALWQSRKPWNPQGIMVAGSWSPMFTSRGDIASGLLAQAFGQEHGTMIVAEVRGEGIPLEAEMPDLVLRLGVAFSQGARLELGLREKPGKRGL